MAKRSVRFFILISLLVSACSTTDDQTSKTTASTEITRTSVSYASTSTINENSDINSSNQSRNDEAIISEYTENNEYFKNFLSYFY